MNILIMVGQLLLSLSLLVFIHELGHFLAAKFFKTRVDKFYLFFDFLFPMPNILNFAIFKKKIGETEYGLGWFPLGGYVSIAGMVDETKTAESLPAEPQPWEYRSKKGWQKLIIIFGGIIFNIIFAFLIFTALLKWHNREYILADSLKNGGMNFTEDGKKMGFRDGDIILNVNGEKIERMEDLTPSSILFGGYYTVSRMENNSLKELKITVPNDFFKTLKSGPIFFPKYHRIKVEKVVSIENSQKLKKGDLITKIGDSIINNFFDLQRILQRHKSTQISIELLRNEQKIVEIVSVDSNSNIGFIPGFSAHKDKYTVKSYTWEKAIKFGILDCWKTIYLQILSFKKMGQGELKVKESVGGPIMMAKMFGAEWDWIRFWSLTALISMGLAFMNALPIPALDGGHAVIILIEMITGRPVNEKTLNILQNIGTILILGLMVYVFYNDILRILGL